MGRTLRAKDSNSTGATNTSLSPLLRRLCCRCRWDTVAFIIYRKRSADTPLYNAPGSSQTAVWTDLSQSRLRLEYSINILSFILIARKLTTFEVEARADSTLDYDGFDLYVGVQYIQRNFL